MKKRILSLLLASFMVLGLAACNTQEDPKGDPNTDKPVATGLAKEDLKVGLILVGEDDAAFNANHVDGMERAVQALGLDYAAQVLVKTGVGEDDGCDTAIRELVESGCQIIFSNSLGHEAYMTAAAPDFPQIQFCVAMGNESARDNLPNTHNYNAKVEQARYLAGIAAGLKTETNRLGYVATNPVADVISGYTAFYLGAKSVNPDVEMTVNYTNEWYDAEKEAANVQILIDLGCDVIGQHSDTAAAATTAEQNGVWAVGYNDDMTMVAPLAALCSARINWGVYYEYALGCLLEGAEIDQDWCGGYADGAVYVSDLNEAVAPQGAAKAIKEAQDAFKAETLHVFVGPLSGVNADGETINLAEGQYYTKDEKSSTPTWDYIIPGIHILP